MALLRGQSTPSVPLTRGVRRFSHSCGFESVIGFSLHVVHALFISVFLHVGREVGNYLRVVINGKLTRSLMSNAIPGLFLACSLPFAPTNTLTCIKCVTTAMHSCFIICPIAIAYSTGQIINLVCVCLSVCQSVCPSIDSHGRIS